MSFGELFWVVLGGLVVWYLFFDGDSWIRPFYRRIKRKFLGGL